MNEYMRKKMVTSLERRRKAHQRMKVTEILSAKTRECNIPSTYKVATNGIED